MPEHRGRRWAALVCSSESVFVAVLVRCFSALHRPLRAGVGGGRGDQGEAAYQVDEHGHVCEERGGRALKINTAKG